MSERLSLALDRAAYAIEEMTGAPRGDVRALVLIWADSVIAGEIIPTAPGEGSIND